MRKGPGLRAYAPLLVLALAACQPEDLGLPSGGSVPADGGATVTAGQTTDAAFDAPRLSPATVAVAASALSAYFVESFDDFEALAEQLRTEDRRYTIQSNRWRRSSTSPVYESYPLASARTEYAHAVGLSGAGQVVSVIDAGFLTSHEALAGLELSFPLGSVPVDRHGTGVASVIAGHSNQMIGVAPGAQLALAGFGTHDALAEVMRDAARRGAVAQNNSWGYEIDATQRNFDAVFGTDNPYFEALADYAREGVVVFAASNDATRTRSTLMEALPALRPELEPGWLAVVNAVPEFDSERVLSAQLISSGCLDAARWCLAADGAWMMAGSQWTQDYRFSTGTSFAAPQVAGALALLGEAFPDLGPHELRARLLASADNGFFEHDGAVELAPGVFHGYSTEFGHGFLDVRAALLPIGRTIVPAESGGGVEVGEPVVVAGAAVGDAVTRALSAHDVLVTDALGGGFQVGAEALVARALPEPLFDGRLASLGAAELGVSAARDGADVLGALSGTRIMLSDPDGALDVSVVAPASGAGTADFGLGIRRVGDGFGFGVTLLRDASGSVGLSPLGDGAGASWAATLDLEATARLSARTELSVFGQVGTMSAPDGNAYARATAAGFAGLGLDLTRRDAFRRGDRIGAGLALPTALTSGQAAMTLPVARDGGAVRFAPVGVDLAPQDREMRLSLSYSAPLGRGWNMVAEGVHSVNRGHVSGATDTGALLGFQARF